MLNDLRHQSPYSSRQPSGYRRSFSISGYYLAKEIWSAQTSLGKAFYYPPRNIRTGQHVPQGTHKAVVSLGPARNFRKGSEIVSVIYLVKSNSSRGFCKPRRYTN